VRQFRAAGLVQQRRLLVPAASRVRIARAPDEVGGLGVTGGLRRPTGDLLQEVTAARREVAESDDQ
jgi:hypothetical protein